MNKATVLNKLRYHAPTILTCIGAVGVVGTAISTARATVKATEILETAKEEKGEALTEKEVFLTVAPAYIPAVMIGSATIACIFGANVLNKRSQAALMSAYAMLDSSYKQYKDKVKELYGEETDKTIKKEIVKDAHKNSDISVAEDKELFFDLFSGRYFESTMKDVLLAEYEINKISTVDGGICVNDFYEMLGLERLPEYDELGWSAAQVYDMCWHPWIEFTHEKTELEDGMECRYIEMLPAPDPYYLEY